jgi:NAD(P)-dependent dehydrogenase (short-subunit alcohol dehydrogenase family)
MVWLVTGCSSGFGLDIVRIALSHGHQVIASSRNPAKIPELVEELLASGGRWLVLDIAKPEADIKQIITDVYKIFGRIDILINNAGCGLVEASRTLAKQIYAHSSIPTYSARSRSSRLFCPSSDYSAVA